MNEQEQDKRPQCGGIGPNEVRCIKRSHLVDDHVAVVPVGKPDGQIVWWSRGPAAQPSVPAPVVRAPALVPGAPPSPLDLPTLPPVAGGSASPGYSGEQCEQCGSMRTVRTGKCTTCQDCYHAGGCG